MKGPRDDLDQYYWETGQSVSRDIPWIDPSTWTDEELEEVRKELLKSPCVYAAILPEVRK